MKKTFLLLASVLMAISSFAAKPTEAQQVRAMIHKVNNYWQTNHKPEVRSFWDNAAYHTGNMEAYFLTGEQSYLDYSTAWAEHNEWMGAKGKDRSAWKYKYGETDDFVLFGDWQICFQTYADLYNILPEPRKIARAREVMEYQMSTPKNDYWWWSDGLYMVMPVMTKMYKLTNNKLYLDKLYEYLSHSDEIMYDYDENLYYRDARYVYPEHKSVNGKKDFWARGDGWVVAGLAKVLKDMPKDYEHRSFFEEKLQKMATALIPLQHKDGYWSRSMMDFDHAPGPETSGTAFFTYGIMWGINNSVLDKETFMPVVDKAWKYLSKTALQKSGAVGYVQPIGEKAIPGQVVDAKSTANFGVGAFLLAACEYVRHLEANEQQDRAYWSDLAYKMAAPVLSRMAKGEFKKSMEVELSPDWGNRNAHVVYLETFGRLMAGIAPWLSLPDDDTAEGKQRKELREWALESYKNGVDPNSPDYLEWETGSSQLMVDGAYLAESFLRGYDALWVPLDDVTKQRYIDAFVSLRRFDPPYTNWILFSATMESFLAKAGGPFDRYRTSSAIRKVNEWYVGDGWYADGEHFAFDYYSSYVFHGMLLETLDVMRKTPGYTLLNYNHLYNIALRRAQRHSMILERFISPEGTFPIFGRSATYRMAAMQPLAQMAWYERLPEGVSKAQVRCALTATLKRVFDNDESFNEAGFLTIGAVGHQPNIADHYTSSGSMYMTTLAFMPLGLPATDPFWTDAPQPWTSCKAWNGDPFPKDHAW